MRKCDDVKRLLGVAAVAVLLCPPTVSAQSHQSGVAALTIVSGPQPVSPGGAPQPTLSAACPTFSWAVSQWATGARRQGRGPGCRTG